MFQGRTYIMKSRLRVNSVMFRSQISPFALYKDPIFLYGLKWDFRCEHTLKMDVKAREQPHLLRFGDWLRKTLQGSFTNFDRNLRCKLFFKEVFFFNIWCCFWHYTSSGLNCHFNGIWNNLVIMRVKKYQILDCRSQYFLLWKEIKYKCVVLWK